MIAITVILVGLAWQDTYAQRSSTRYFPETGHWVSGEFLDLYESVENPDILYGYPITDAFEDPRTFRTVQYFERARFELHPEETYILNVQRTPLGALLYKPGRPLPEPMNSPTCQTFPETGYQVCDAFLKFFNAHGKVPQFGYPISNIEYHDGLIVQYFQLARLEWHPNEKHGQRVRVSNLGQLYFFEMREDPRLTIPKRGNSAIQVVTQIKTKAYPKHAILESKGQQTIFIIVHDQNFIPIKDAKVNLEVLLPSGKRIKNPEPLTTNEDGIASYQFAFSNVPKGDVVVKIASWFGNYEARSSTSFRIWW